MGIQENMAARCPCCDVVNVDMRYARIFSRTGAQLVRHKPLLHENSRTLNRLEIQHQVERGESFTAGRKLRMDIVITGEELFGGLQTRSTARPSTG